MWARKRRFPKRESLEDDEGSVGDGGSVGLSVGLSVGGSGGSAEASYSSSLAMLEEEVTNAVPHLEFPALNGCGVDHLCTR